MSSVIKSQKVTFSRVSKQHVSSSFKTALLGVLGLWEVLCWVWGRGPEKLRPQGAPYLAGGKGKMHAPL